MREVVRGILLSLLALGLLCVPATATELDRETGSTWNLLGHAVRGPLAGKRLRAVSHVDAFWFAWAAFNPATSIYGAP